MSKMVNEVAGAMNASETLELLARVKILEEENNRLRLANALLTWTPESKKRGRPQTLSLESDIELLTKIEGLQKIWNLPNRRSVIRRAQGMRQDGKYRSETKLAQELATLEKALSRASRQRKTSNK